MKFKKYFQKSGFTHDVLTLMTGTTIAQAIPIAISPILTRLFTPEDFGVLALFISIGSISSTLVTGKYDMAIILPKKIESSLNIVILSFFLSICVSILILILIFLFKNNITSLLGNKEVGNYLYLIPLSTFLTGVYNINLNWSNRKQKYKEIATANVLKTTSREFSNLSLSLFSTSATILILSTIFSQFFSTTYLVIKNKLNINFQLIRDYNLAKIKNVAIEYVDFPKVTIGHSFFNLFSAEMVVFFLSHFFLGTVVGFYALAKRVVLLPSAMISGAMGKPFYKKLVELKEKDALKSYLFVKKTARFLLLLALLPSILLFIFAPSLFSFIFGESWREAGVYTQILVPFFFFRFVGSVISYVVLVYNKQKKAFYIEFSLTILRVIALVIGGLFVNVYLALILFSLVSTIVSLYRLFWYLSIVKSYKKNQYDSEV